MKVWRMVQLYDVIWKNIKKCQSEDSEFSWICPSRSRGTTHCHPLPQLYSPFWYNDDIELLDRITSTSETRMFVALLKNAQALRWRIRASLVLHCNYCSEASSVAAKATAFCTCIFILQLWLDCHISIRVESVHSRLHLRGSCCIQQHALSKPRMVPSGTIQCAKFGQFLSWPATLEKKVKTSLNVDCWPEELRKVDESSPAQSCGMLWLCVGLICFLNLPQILGSILMYRAWTNVLKKVWTSGCRFTG